MYRIYEYIYHVTIEGGLTMKVNSKWLGLRVVILMISALTLGCGDSEGNVSEDTSAIEETVESAEVVKISAEEAQVMMASGDPYTLVDVRTQAEFDEGHIEGAILLPNDEIETLAPDQLKDKEAVILVYCRSGNRSAQASNLLVELGYTNVYDFGGIIDWPGDIVK